ncbi:Carboxymuconolactone decarboxylase family protein [Maioricimonas rarisocia]|uniref:Carboxymuconolactone decarboxylase family protein n=1 Tax=Maioricimonas rarisocia TaxID=2528026 RepID=A0A517ZG55_9PLAN|nr:carboxymuconolactone decarboxylase family protein [Maioricimonas rarisocia]QDU41463.1 Carboxymuconolactone decarboxylase family protein [Maioricimonas rarisocia]
MSTAQSTFAPLSIDDAPEASRGSLEAAKKKYGFVPQILGVMAHAPATLDAYMTLGSILEKSSFSPKEQQLILLAASVENECGYCTAAHSTVLKSMLKVDAETVAAVREGRELSDAKQDALVTTVREIVRERGHVSEETVKSFTDAGYSQPQLLELLVGVAMKTLSNYLDHITPVEVDEAFAAEK